MPDTEPRTLRNVYAIPYSGAMSYVATSDYRHKSLDVRKFTRSVAEKALEIIRKDPMAAGLVVLGGGDIDPTVYGRMPGPHAWGSDKEQDLAEIMCIQESPVPVFGFCRGMQLCHVALSRDNEMSPLDQHLAEHLAETSGGHSLRFVSSWPEFGYSQGDMLYANSIHHQGLWWRENLRQSFPNLNVLAVTVQEHPVVEIATWKNKYGQTVLGTQYHPEMLIRRKDVEMMQNLFK